VGRAHVRALGLVNAGFDAHGDGLRGYHYRLLAALEEFGPRSQADVGRDTGIDRSDVTAALTELEARGLVERTVDQANRRRKIVTITERGVERLRELDGVIDGVQEEFLGPLTEPERREFLGLLARLTRE
jgi:DNA-binding MarR family transcriptional regulator